MQTRYFIMTELAAIAHDLDLLVAQLNEEQDEAEKREKEMADKAKAGIPVASPLGPNKSIDKELTFLGDRFAALYDYYIEELQV